MAKSRSQQLYKKAEEERQRCVEWLRPCVRENHLKFLSKAELRDAARRELKVSKNAFDFAWIQVIEKTGRYDWYEPPHQKLTASAINTAGTEAGTFWSALI
jgi:hypothetical protein